jgi:PhnB protein
MARRLMRLQLCSWCQTPADSTSYRRPPVPTPYLRVHDAAAAIAFYTTAFGANEVVRLTEPSGRVAHAELAFGRDDDRVMLSDEYPDLGVRGPVTLGATPVALQLYVDDVDAVCARVAEHHGRIVHAPALDPFGDRSAKVIDPFGHEWLLATRIETIEPAEMRRRFDQMIDSEGQ